MYCNQWFHVCVLFFVEFFDHYFWYWTILDFAAGADTLQAVQFVALFTLDFAGQVRHRSQIKSIEDEKLLKAVKTEHGKLEKVEDRTGRKTKKRETGRGVCQSKGKIDAIEQSPVCSSTREAVDVMTSWTASFQGQGFVGWGCGSDQERSSCSSVQNAGSSQGVWPVIHPRPLSHEKGSIQSKQSAKDRRSRAEGLVVCWLPWWFTPLFHTRACIRTKVTAEPGGQKL